VKTSAENSWKREKTVKCFADTCRGVEVLVMRPLKDFCLFYRLNCNEMGSTPTIIFWRYYPFLGMYLRIVPLCWVPLAVEALIRMCATQMCFWVWIVMQTHMQQKNGFVVITKNKKFFFFFLFDTVNLL
jgi:hypothetical protein